MSDVFSASADADTHRAADAAVVSGHTPGPWMVEVGTNHLWVGPEKAVGGKVGDIVVSLEYGPDYRLSYCDKQEANARLIAAAPDLLEAASVLRELFCGDTVHMALAGNPIACERMEQRIAVAVAKSSPIIGAATDEAAEQPGTAEAVNPNPLSDKLGGAGQ